MSEYAATMARDGLQGTLDKLALADAMDLPHLVRAVHGVVVEPLRKGNLF